MLVRPRSGVSPLQAFLEAVMAARRTGSRLVGIALVTLCVSTAAHGQQVLFAGSAAGCFGMVCVPLTSFVTLPGSGISPRWETFTGPTNTSAFETNHENENSQGGQNEDDRGVLHFNKATAASTGLAFTLFVSFLNASLANSHADHSTGTDDFARFAGVADPTTFSTPVAAHLEFAETSAIVTSPEPATLALMATGLLAVAGAGLLRRRRRRAAA